MKGKDGLIGDPGPNCHMCDNKMLVCELYKDLKKPENVMFGDG